MLSKGLFLLLMCLFTNSVTSLFNGNSKDVRIERNVKPRYNFNHPPLAEDYNPIPVDVIYEDDSDDSGKSESQTNLNNSDENITVNVNNEEYEQTTSKEQKNFTATVFVSNAENKTNAKLAPTPRTSKNFQIPVSIAYEGDSNTKRINQRIKTETATETSKRRQNYSRKVQNKTADTQKEQITIKVDTEKPKPSVETRTFKKRTEGRSPVVPILESENYVFAHSGNFHYSYEGGDGTKAYSEGRLKTVDEDAGEAVVGGFSYTDKDGNDFSLSYTADENGYRPVGDHLPTPPPIPPAIARALAYLATATPEPVTKRPAKSKLLVT